MRLSLCLLVGLTHAFANNFLRGKVTSARGIGKYEDATGTLRDLPIDFEWTAEQVAFIKYKYNIAIPSQRTSARGYYSFTQQSPFPIKKWPTSYSKRTTIIPILISRQFPITFIKQLERTINSLTSQAGCVEFLPIEEAELTSFANYVSIEPSTRCATMVGLPDGEERKVSIELATDCRESPLVIRSLLLHAAGLAPNKIAGRKISPDELSPYKLCSRTGVYSLCERDPSCTLAQPRGYVVARTAGSRDEAVMVCQREYGMELAIVSTPEEARIIQYLLANDDPDLERSKFWLGNRANQGLIGGKWKGLWAAGFPSKQAINAPVHMSYSASGWEWRNDLTPSSKLPAICEAAKATNTTPYAACLNNLCSTNARCLPSASAYICKCQEGFYGSGFTCLPSKCPAGTIQLKESCVRDSCTQCKPRFACRNENAGTPSATCKCKEGWAGNGKLCLPKKSVRGSELASFDERETETNDNLVQMLQPEAPLKKSNAGIAALNALTSKLNALSKKQRTYNIQSTQSLWRTDPPLRERTTSFASKIADQQQISQAPLQTQTVRQQATVATTTTTPRPIIISHPPVNVDGIKSDVSDLQQETELVKLKSEKIRLQQEKLQGDVDRVLALVQAFMSQTKEDRADLDKELERLRDYSDQFNFRIDQISNDVHEVENLKKSAVREEEQMEQLNKIAANLREEIFHLEDQVKTTVDETEKKVNTVEGQVLQNRINVDKAQYQNQHNKLRIEQAEQEIQELAEVGEAVEETTGRLMDAESNLGDLSNWVGNLDSALESQHYDLEDKSKMIEDNSIQIKLVEDNIDKVKTESNKATQHFNKFRVHMNHKTENIIKKEAHLEQVVEQVKQESANFTSMIDTVSSDVVSHHLAFEKGLKTASTSAAYAKQKAENAANQLATYVKRTNRANQNLFGKINRQNDLLAYLMSKVQKLEEEVQKNKHQE